MSSPEQVVREFCAGVSTRDPEVLRPLLAPNVVYQNVGVDKSEGVDATLAHLGGQWQTFGDCYEYELVNLASSGHVVLTERIDRVGAGGGAPIAPIPVMGRFEVEDGRITKWIDYFDMALAGKMMGGEDVKDVIPS